MGKSQGVFSAIHSLTMQESRKNTPPSQSEQSRNRTDNNQSSSAAVASTSRRRRKKKYAVSTRWEREVAEHGPIRDFHHFFCCCARRLGNMFVLCERTDGSPVVISGPCWPFCTFVTLPLILAVS